MHTRTPALGRVARAISAIATMTTAIAPASVAAQKSPTSERVAPKSYLVAWTGDSARRVSDFLAVIDADPTSKTYGHVVTSLAVGATGTQPHHTEYEFPADAMLFANGFAKSKSFVVDLRNPTAPKLVATFDKVGPYAFPHSFARLANGRVLATAQGKGTAFAPPGGIVELDEHGTTIRYASAAGRGLADTLTWPYSLAVDAAHDRFVVTNSVMLIPEWLHTPPGSWRKARADSVTTSELEFWQLSTLRLLSVAKLPVPPNAKRIAGYTNNELPAEPRLLPDGSMYVNTFACGLYHITAIDSQTPHVALVHEFQRSPDMYCAVPAIVGHYWIQTVGALNGLVALDISNPAHPVEVARLKIDPRAGMPHWLASDTRANRIVLTPDNGGSVFIINVDPKTGAMSFDKNFRDERTGAVGVSLDGRHWPHGDVAKAYVHGTLFGPR